MPNDRAYEDMIDVVRETSRREIMPRFRRLSATDITTKTGPNDLVTKADLAAERSLIRGLEKVLPQAAMIAEEEVSKAPGLLDAIAQRDLSIVIDPIDGTGNFACGIAVFGVIVAVVAKGETVFGLLYDPVMDDWVFAERNGGAWHTDGNPTPSRLATSSAEGVDGSKGLVPLNACEGHERAELLGRFDQAAQVQDLRCSCHDYRLLASGQSDFMVSVALKPWDHAAGQLVVKEAGGWSIVDRCKAYSPLLRNGRMVAAGRARLGEAIAESFFAEPCNR